MIAKLYRGPKHGTTLAVPDGMREIVVAVTPKNSYRPHEEVFMFEKIIYSMVLVEVNIDGYQRRIPAVHPDGGVYFECNTKRRVRH